MQLKTPSPRNPLVLAALAATLLAATGAQAVVVDPGTSASLPGTSLLSSPNLAGMVLEDFKAPYSFAYGAGTIRGTVESRVVRETATGTLDFYWRITNSASSINGLPQFQLTNFIASTYDLDWRSDGAGNTSPGFAYLAPDLTTSIPLVYFFFQSDTIGPGESSYFLLLHTDATQYAKTGLYVVNPLDSFDHPLGPRDYYATFAPLAVPEPQSYALMLAGLAVVAGVGAARRKSARQSS